MTALAFDHLDRLLGTAIRADVACPACADAEHRTTANRRRRVLRLWRLDNGGVSYRCARCGVAGTAYNDSPRAETSPLDRMAARVRRAQQEAADAVERASRRAKASRLWRMRQPIAGTPAETYLRQARGYHGPLPATLGYLPARDDYSHAMIAAFGLSSEPEPGALDIADDAVTAVHLTRLATNGRGKAGGDRDKIMLGTPSGSPIILAPPNDLMAISITEGIEDALSVHEALGIGAWAAGSASFLPKLADVVPLYIETVHVIVHDDIDGRRHARELVRRLRGHGVEVIARLLRVREAAE